MEWFNFYGLIFISAIMIPNIIFAFKTKGRFEESYKNKAIEAIEQAGRFGCIFFMIFFIPKTMLWHFSKEAFIIYLAANIVFSLVYCLLWIILFKSEGLFKALALSIIPSLMFLLSGFLSGALLLIISALLFAPAHIFISYKNAKK